MDSQGKNHNYIIQQAASLASMKKGQSLNDRDDYVSVRVIDGRCRIISGGLLAIVSTEFEVIDTPDMEFELRSELLSDVASSVNQEDLQLKCEDSHVVLSAPGVMLKLLNSAFKWSNWTNIPEVDSVEIAYNLIEGALSATPRIQHDEGEKWATASVQIKASEGFATFNATDGRMASSITIPCVGSFREVLIPFAVVPSIVWAAREFGSESNPVKLGIHGGDVIVRCGMFSASVRQIACNFPDVARVLHSVQFRSHTVNVDVSVQETLSITRNAAKMEYLACTFSFPLDDGPTITAHGETADESMACKWIDVVAAAEMPTVAIKMDSEYVSTSMTALSKLGFDRACMGVGLAGEPVIMSAKREGIDATMLVAALRS